MNIIEQVRKFVYAECRKPTSHYGHEPFNNHFEPTVKYAKRLAVEFEADLEIVTIAAWIHDIGSIIMGRENHHVTGAKIAEEKLREFGYPEEKLQIVKKCVLNHRGSQKRKLETLEEQIVAEADAMSAFDNISGLFKAAFVFENLTQEEATISVARKLENKWRQLKLDGSRDLIRPKYEAIMFLLLRDDEKI